MSEPARHGDRYHDPLRRAGAGRAGVAVAAALRDAARWVLPVECAGCGAWDVPLCAACAAAFDGGVPARVEAGVPRLDRLDGVAPLPVWAVARYAGAVRGVVLAWKDHGRADLGRLLTRAAARAGHELAAQLAGAATGAGPILVVPVPTTAHARRRRGADLVDGLAVSVAAGLDAAGVPARRRRALVVARRRLDQAGLGARARAANAVGSVRVRGTSTLDALPVLLVDDVVTTGATLGACEAALVRRGALVLGAVVLAATPEPAHSGTHRTPGAAARRASDGIRYTDRARGG